MSGAVFVDANVLLYACDSSEPAKNARARQWLERLWAERAGRTSVQVLSEYYVNATRKLRPGLPAEVAWEDVTGYFAWNPLPIDKTLLLRAREIERRYRLSWWDSLIVGAAQLQDCRILLTEDLQDGAAFGALVVRSPFTLELEQPRAAYEVPPAVALHRPRGRPRRVFA